MLVNILRRLGSHAVPGVCRTFRRVYHERATSVTFARPFVLPEDDGTVAVMDSCRKLVSARATMDTLKAWHWPTGRMLWLRHLSVPMRWCVDEISPTLQTLELTGKVIGGRAWADTLLARMASSRCVITIPEFICSISAYASHHEDLLGGGQCHPKEWAGFDFSRVRLLKASVTSGVVASEILRSCASSLRKMEVERQPLASLDGVTLQQLTALELGRGLTSLRFLANAKLPQLKDLCVHESRLASFDGLVGAQLTQLTSLVTCYCPVTSLHGLDGANLRSLKYLQVHSAAVTDLRGLSGVGASALKALDLSCNSRLATLQGLQEVGLDNLVHLDLSDAAITSLRGLGTLPALTSLELHSCQRLRTLQHLVTEAPRLRRLGLGGCTALEFEIGLATADVVTHDSLDWGMRDLY